MVGRKALNGAGRLDGILIEGSAAKGSMDTDNENSA